MTAFSLFSPAKNREYDVYIYKYVKNDKIQTQQYSSLDAAIEAICQAYGSHSTRPIGVYGNDGKTVVLNRNQLLEKFARFEAS